VRQPLGEAAPAARAGPGVACAPGALRAVLDACARAGDVEACGALLGTLDPIRVARAVPVENTAAEPGRGYAIPAARVRELDRDAADPGLHVVGFYHSHPVGPATPSAADLAGAWPGYVYLIVGRGRSGAVARAWRLRQDRRGLDEVSLRTGTTT
jgi:proteasome lid subunit RPN8/RPN11